MGAEGMNFRVWVQYSGLVMPISSIVGLLILNNIYFTWKVIFANLSKLSQDKCYNRRKFNPNENNGLFGSLNVLRP